MQRKFFCKITPIVYAYFFLSLPFGQASDLFDDKQKIESLIESNNLLDADSEISKLKRDYSNAPYLPCALYWIGRKYEWSKNDLQANEIYRHIIQNYPNSEYSTKSKLSIAKQNIFSLIISGEYELARQKTDKMVNNFINEPALPETLYWIGRRYGWSNRYKDEKRIFEQIIQSYPQSPYTDKVRISLSRIPIQFLIMSCDFEQAEKALDKFIVDFTENPTLPDELYWIAERYRWAEKYEQAKNLYQQIIRDYPDSPSISKIQFGLSRVEVLSLIDSLNFGLAKQALQKLVIDFSSEPDLPENLYWIARKYEWTNRYNDAKDIYEKIVQNYPDNDLLIISKAKIGIARMDACLFITSGNAEDANILVTKIKSDFIDNPVYANTLYEIARVYDYCKSIEQAERLHKAVVESSDIRLSSKASIEQAKLEIFRLIDNNDCIKFDDAIAKLRENFEDRPDLPETIQTIANKCAASGYEYESVGNYEKANWCFEQAISISKIVITEFHPSRELTPQAYYITAVCYQRLGDHEQAILNCQKALDDWPDNENSWRVLLTMAQSYEQMADAELISDEFASEQINIICDKLLSYSDFQANKAVHGLLKEWASSK